VGSTVAITASPGEDSSLAVEKLNYTWTHGKLFGETQELFTKVKSYLYNPLMQNATVIRETGGWGFL